MSYENEKEHPGGTGTEMTPARMESTESLREDVQGAVLETQGLPRVSVTLDNFSNGTWKPLKGWKPKSKLMIKKIPPGTSLVIQWLRLQALSTRVQGLIPGRGAKILHATCAARKRKYSSRSHGESRFRGNRVGRESG